MNKNQLWLALAWASLIIVGSCARRGTPTGGDKDTIPPVLLTTVPELETVNFRGDLLVLEFDELIDARSLKKELIITPPIEEYDYYVKKNQVFIELEEELRDSTTYTFNFGEALQDLSEGNKAENAILAFSTGSYIDSFQVSGTVRQLLTQEPSEDAVIALYDVRDTLDAFTGPPMYFAKADEDGNYNIRYIKPGLYRIYAYQDENSNLEIETDKESYGFRADTLYIGTVAPEVVAEQDSSQRINLDNISLALVRKNTQPLKLQSSRANGKYYEFKFNKGIRDYSLVANKDDLLPDTERFIEDSLVVNTVDSTRYLFYNLQDEGEMLRVYNTLRQDSLYTTLSVTDSTGQMIRDSVFYVQFTESRRKAETFQTQFDAGEDAIEQSIRSTVRFNKPVIRINTDSILLSYDTLYYLPINYKQALTWNQSLDEVTLSILINSRELVDSVLFYQRRSDSLAFVRQQQLALTYLDSLRQTQNLENQRKYLQTLARVRRTDETLTALQDSIANTQDDELATQLIRSFVDTMEISGSFTPGTYERSAVSENLKPLNFYAAPGSFRSVEGDSSEAIIQRYTFKDPEKYGLLSGIIDLPYESFFLQLLDENFEVVRELKNPERYTFRMVPPGTYRLRVLVDADQDGEWEDGNILLNEEPEPVFIFQEELTIRQNWENEIMIDNSKLSTLSSE